MANEKAKAKAKKPPHKVTAYPGDLRCGDCNMVMYWPAKNTVSCGTLGCKSRGIKCAIPTQELKRV